METKANLASTLRRGSRAGLEDDKPASRCRLGSRDGITGDLRPVSRGRRTFAVDLEHTAELRATVETNWDHVPSPRPITSNGMAATMQVKRPASLFLARAQGFLTVESGASIQSRRQLLALRYATAARSTSPTKPPAEKGKKRPRRCSLDGGSIHSLAHHRRGSFGSTVSGSSDAAVGIAGGGGGGGGSGSGDEKEGGATDGKPPALMPRVFGRLIPKDEKGELIPLSHAQRVALDRCAKSLRSTFRLLTSTDPIRVARALDIEIALDAENPTLFVFPRAKGKGGGKGAAGKGKSGSGFKGNEGEDLDF